MNIANFSEWEPGKAGIFQGFPMEAYQAAAGLSKSRLDLLARSPRLFAESLTAQRAPTLPMQIGTATHSLFWENRTDFIEKPVGFDGRTKDGRAWLAQQREGAIILTADQAADIRAGVDALRNHPHVRALGDLGVAEVSMFARDEARGRMLKGRADSLRLNATERSAHVFDLKTTADGSTRAFSRDILARRYHVQAAMYRRILRRLGYDGAFAFTFVVLEKGESPLVSVRHLAAQAIDLGDRALDDDLELYHRCRISDTWPDYADQEERASFIDLPDFVYGDTDVLTGMTTAA